MGHYQRISRISLLCEAWWDHGLQDMLPALYRGHDALLFTSRYEAWGMPVLEGMASGLPVVATSCLGVQTFAQHGVNALLADPQVPTHAQNCQAAPFCDSANISIAMSAA